MVVLEMLQHTLIVDRVVVLSQRRLLVRNLHLIFEHVAARVLESMVGFAASRLVLVFKIRLSMMHVPEILLSLIVTSYDLVAVLSRSLILLLLTALILIALLLLSDLRLISDDFTNNALPVRFLCRVIVLIHSTVVHVVVHIVLRCAHHSIILRQVIVIQILLTNIINHLLIEYIGRRVLSSAAGHH